LCKDFGSGGCRLFGSGLSGLGVQFRRKAFDNHLLRCYNGSSYRAMQRAYPV